ncbi:MAG TPA: NYN domain-containing protein [Terracidiphilus sp.]|nr:NYN domain-containing protein [Terracidiphilus sp.]
MRRSTFGGTISAIPPQSSERGREPPQGGFAFGGKIVNTNVYVDGFNLYYGAAKYTPFKWVDLATLCANVLPGISIHRIRYFTALVKPLPSDPQTRMRQDIYIRALQTIPNLSVHFGHYLQSTVMMRLASPPPGGNAFAEVIKMEEKGSDVNIATYMLIDAFRRDCDQLVVITNDSDLAEPVRIINKELNISVGIFNPQTADTAVRRSRVTGRPPQKARPSVELKKVSRFYREITSEGPACHMALSQFPNVLTDASGHMIRKPTGW